jgi:hypothetical protein
MCPRLIVSVSMDVSVIVYHARACPDIASSSATGR